MTTKKVLNFLFISFFLIVLSQSCASDDTTINDADKDGVADVDDNCPNSANSDQQDADQDGIGDVCDDDDNDGVLNLEDNCIALANNDQLDTDGDGIGDACDEDDDNDTILDVDDNCPLIANTDQADADNDGIGDVCEDSDNDGIVDANDNCIDIPNPDQADVDGDGLGDACDTTYSFTKVPCVGGTANEFECNGYDLELNIPLTVFEATAGNDSWGWTDPMTNREYALMALNNGVAFVDVTDPNEAIYLGKLPTATSSSTWRDVKVYNDHAFVVSEANNHGMQVFDLTRLRNLSNIPETFTSDARYTGFGSAHNIVINEDSGYAYAVGTTQSSGGPLFINIQDPKNPKDEGGYSQDAYSHDAQVVTYNGPDTDYVGKEILIGSNENEIAIVDVTDKANPQRISTISYGNVGYVHQGWFTDDQRYFILGDELDETRFGFNSRSIVFDFNDLDNPQLKFEYTGPTAAIDHNGYVNGNLFYLANYTAGIRVIDISNIGGSSINEVGFFDTYPETNNAAFEGVWSVYPYFDSGNIVVSDINRGLFIVKKNN